MCPMFMKGTLYEEYPLLAYTPYGQFDIMLGMMIRMHTDAGFLSIKTLAPVVMNKSMGDFVPTTSRT